jgi:trans-2,3-dihydro-3-hydroxyanthranilate isomerase
MLFQPRSPEIFVRKLPRERTVGVHLYVQAKEGNIEIQTRMFAPQHGTPGDAATSMLESVPGH